MRKITAIPVVANGKPTFGEDKKRHWSECVPRKTECVHPICSAIYREMKNQGCTYEMLAKRSGVSVSAIQALRKNGPGYFANVEAVANVLGFKILAMPTGRGR